MRPSVTVVMPVWNEGLSIRRVIEDVIREVPPVAGSAQVVVVDDASTDGTAEVLAELAGQVAELEVIRLPRNLGHGGAVLAGLARARGEWIFQLDSDGQFVVAEFDRLWERREDTDLVLGVRAERRDPAHRLVLSRVVRVAVSALALRRVRDPNIPFRLFRRAVWEDLAPLVGEHALAPSILTVVGAIERGWRVTEVEVTHLPSGRGGSTLQSWRLVRFSARGFAQLLRFRIDLVRAGRRGAGSR